MKNLYYVDADRMFSIFAATSVEQVIEHVEKKFKLITRKEGCNPLDIQIALEDTVKKFLKFDGKITYLKGTERTKSDLELEYDRVQCNPCDIMYGMDRSPRVLQFLYKIHALCIETGLTIDTSREEPGLLAVIALYDEKENPILETCDAVQEDARLQDLKNLAIFRPIMGTHVFVPKDEITAKIAGFWREDEDRIPIP